jgi:hypothetical protein
MLRSKRGLTRFFVVFGHFFPDVERIVQQRSGYVVADKDRDQSAQR